MLPWCNPASWGWPDVGRQSAEVVRTLQSGAEVRAYQLKPGSLNDVLTKFTAGYEHRKQFSGLVAFWYTEIGPLNEIIHVWPYADTAERDRVRAEAAASPSWPPPLREHQVG